MEQVYESICAGNNSTKIVVHVPKNHQAYADTFGYVNADISCHRTTAIAARLL